MAIARLIDCDQAHKQYCALYWEKNELQLIEADYPGKVISNAIARIEAEQAKLITFLGYTPAP